jgi:voltage-gated potassium channel
MSTASNSSPAPVPVEVNKREQLLNDYSKKTSTLLSGLALVFLVTFSIQAIWPDTGAPWYFWMSVFSNALWALFALDLLIRFILTTNKRTFFVKNWLDTLTVVVPQLRALRALRAFSANGILSKGKGFFTSGAITTAILGTAIIVWVGSLSVLTAERGAKTAEIKTLPDSLWWSFETITTVGYGDFVPVTWWGRFIAVLIMMVGISLLGVISAGLAATLVKQNKPDPAAEVMAELSELKSMVAQLQQQLSSMGGATAPK